MATLIENKLDNGDSENWLKVGKAKDSKKKKIPFLSMKIILSIKKDHY